MNKEQTELFSDRIWKISVETKYGTDIVLVCQEDEPTKQELLLIADRFQRDYDIEAAANIDCGFIDVGAIPQGINHYLEVSNYV
jgi:cupin superfamily acireductone dioxygenase involved in methionine salvage